jgi:hypothetical protein
MLRCQGTVVRRLAGSVACGARHNGRWQRQQQHQSFDSAEIRCQMQQRIAVGCQRMLDGLDGGACRVGRRAEHKRVEHAHGLDAVAIGCRAEFDCHL